MSCLAAVLGAVCLLAPPAAGEPTPGDPPVPREESVAGLPPIDADAYRRHVEVLADPRMRGRFGADSRPAARYVARRLAEIGLTPLFGTRFIEPILDKDAREIGENVGAMLVGSDPTLRGEYVLVTAHHDHIGVRGGRVYPGANDNASGVAMVLESARVLAQTPHPRTLVFVSFGLEERMLWGSRTFAADPPLELSRIQLFITADMLGRPVGGLPLPEVFVIGGESVAIAGEPPGAYTDFVASTGSSLGQPVLRIGGDVVGTRSDYGPFRDREVPFLFFSTGENPDYHQPGDTAERLEYDLATGATSVIAAVAADAADRPDRLTWATRRPPQVAEAETMRRVSSLVLREAKEGRFDLPLVQQVLVQQVYDRSSTIVDRGSMSEAERTVLKRAAQAMMVAIF